MAQSLYTLENITYVAGRHYVHDGRIYEPGDIVADARHFRNVEAMVRSRHLIPVVKNANDVPVYYQKDVKVAALVEEKYRLTIKWDGNEDGVVEENEDGGYDPAEHTIPEVLDWAKENVASLDLLIEAELEGKNRTTLLDQLLTLGSVEENEAENAEENGENDE